MTDTPPSAEQIIAECRACRPLDSLSSVAREGQLGLAALDIKALTAAGKIIVDKDELQDICNAIAVGDQASAWEKLTSMTTDIGS